MMRKPHYSLRLYICIKESSYHTSTVITIRYPLSKKQKQIWSSVFISLWTYELLQQQIQLLVTSWSAQGGGDHLKAQSDQPILHDLITCLPTHSPHRQYDEWPVLPMCQKFPAYLGLLPCLPYPLSTHKEMGPGKMDCTISANCPAHWLDKDFNKIILLQFNIADEIPAWSPK